jgi:hypothetical protein
MQKAKQTSFQAGFTGGIVEVTYWIEIDLNFVTVACP